MGKGLKVLLIIAAIIGASISIFVVGFKLGITRNIPFFNTEYIKEEINKELDLFSKIKVDLSVSDLIINATTEKTASISYIDFLAEDQKVYEITVTNTDGLLTIKDNRPSFKFTSNTTPKSTVILMIPDDIIIEDLSSSINVGNLTITNRFIEQASLKVDVGNVKVDTQANKGEFSYHLDADVGKITIDGQSTGGISSTLVKENDAATSHLKASTHVGSIDIQFNN